MSNSGAVRLWPFLRRSSGVPPPSDLSFKFLRCFDVIIPYHFPNWAGHFENAGQTIILPSETSLPVGPDMDRGLFAQEPNTPDSQCIFQAGTSSWAESIMM
jgi:hypothetical protein